MSYEYNEQQPGTYHGQGIHNYGVNMRASGFICNVAYVADDGRLQAKLANPVCNACAIVHGIHVQDSSLLEGVHLLHNCLQRHRAQLRGDSEEETRALADF